MRARTLLALAALAAVVAGAITLGDVRPRALGSAAPLGTASGSWFCPHGGGHGWSTELSLVNPGTSAVRIRITELGEKGSKPAHAMTVPPGADVRVPVDSPSAASATEVEYFDGWIGASWVTYAHGGQSGLAAEPCEPALSRTWIVPDGTTLRGESGWIVVMNPTSADAIFGIRLLSEGSMTSPGQWASLVLRPGRSASFDPSRFVLGKRTVSTVVDATIGRVAVAGIGVSSSGGVRAADGIPAAERTFTLPGGPDSGRSELVVADPGGGKASYHGTLELPGGPQAISQLNGESLAPDQAKTYDVSTTPDATVELQVASSTGVAVARRSFGPSGDEGSTSGASPAAAWVAQGGAVSKVGTWRLSLANPGRAPAQVQLRLIGANGGTAGSPVRRVTVPAGHTVVVAAAFTAGDPFGAVVAVATSGTFVPLVTSFTGDRKGYSVAAGEPIPARWIPEPPS